MKRITLAMFAIGVATVLPAQTPPARPVPVAPPATEVRPAPAPKAIRVLPP